MSIDEIRDTLEELRTHIAFELDGVPCGVEPYSREEYEMWYGEAHMTARSVDEAMAAPFFGGKTLTQLAELIQE